MVVLTKECLTQKQVRFSVIQDCKVIRAKNDVILRARYHEPCLRSRGIVKYKSIQPCVLIYFHAPHDKTQSYRLEGYTMQSENALNKPCK